MKNLEYYYDDNRFVASIDNGSSGFFVRHGTKAENGDWEFVIPGSKRWDALHKDIYWAHHDLSPCQPEISKNLPPIPEIPTYTQIQWKDNFLPLDPLPVVDFPEITKRIQNNPANEAYFWFSLNEDLYETYLGDGEFHYFSGDIFETEQQAVMYIEPRNLETKRLKEEEHQYGEIHTIRSFSITIDNGFLMPINWEPKGNEDYRIEKIVRKIEETLRKAPL